MTERARLDPSSHVEPPAAPATGFDQEIHVREIVKVGLSLVALSVASFAIVWGLYHGLVAAERESDPRPPAIAGPAPNTLPPVPRLQGIERDALGRQITAERELAATRAAEDAHLASWGWVDRSAGVAHIPIERAMELSVVDAGKPAAAAASATP